MSDPIYIAKTLSIRDCGYDEYWLQDQIFANPSILGLGELEVVKRERRQSSGGKLDLLVKSADDNAMYEVEIMLGATDESHIIRTIEYWDLERRRWPQRQHTGVIVAELITRRFFNVVQLLSLSIPIIAIHANIIEADGKRILNFNTVLDAYEEPEDEVSLNEEVCDENWWRNRSAWNLETAKSLLKIISPVYGRMELGFAKYWVALKTENNFFNQFRLRPRSGNKSLLDFWVNDTDLDEVSSAFDQKRIPFSRKKASKGTTQIALTIDQNLVETNSDLFFRIAEFVKKC